MVPSALSAPLITTFGIATVSALVLLWRARSRAARLDQVSKVAAGAASINMVMPTSIPLLLIAELVFFTAAATWFLARLGDGERSAGRMPAIVGHIHSIFMMGAMAVMAYQSLRMVVPSSAAQSAHAHQLSGMPDLTLAALAAVGVLVAGSSVVHYRASRPVGSASRGFGGWTTWGIGARESVGTVLLIAAMSV